MKIFKHASSTYHPSHWGKLRVGTLYNFRKPELGDRSDEGEGTYLYNVNCMGGETSLVNQLLGGRIHREADKDPILSPPGSLCLDIRELNTSTGFYSCSITQNVFNGFVLCLSLAGPGEEGIFQGAVPIWSLKDEMIDDFARVVAGELLRETSKKDFLEPAARLVDFDALSATDVRIKHGPVQYKERVYNFFKGVPGSLDNLARDVASAPFIKPPQVRRFGEVVNYSQEKEYRIVFEFTSGSRKIPPKVSHVDISYDALRDLIEEVPLA